MKSNELTRGQTDKLLTNIEPMLGYLSRVSQRMDKRGMGGEKLADDVRKAHQAMQSLRMTLHYLNCAGVGDQANRPK